MKDKKLFYMMFLVCVIAIFAYLVMAEFAGEAVSVVSPAADANYSGNLLLNATLNNTDETQNATNVTFYFFNATSGTLVYNTTVLNTSNVNQTRFNATIDSSTLLADGTYNLTVNATNVSEALLENSTITGIQIDNTNPLVTINTANNTFLGSVTTSLVFNVTVTDSGSGVLTTADLQNNSETNESASQVGTATSREFNRTVVTGELAEGGNTLTVVVNDTITAANGGINTNSSETITVWLDTTTPTVTLFTPANWTWTDDFTPDFVFNFTDDNSPNASCELFIDGTGYGINSTTLNDTQTTMTANTSLSAGAYTWLVNCTDLGSNIGTISDPFFLDVLNVDIVTPTNATFINDTATSSLDFNFSFLSGLINSTAENNVSCELWVTNSSGDYVANGVNTTALNNTNMTITNNQTLVYNLSTNWTINCSYNSTQITAVDNSFYTFGVDNETPYGVSVSCTEVPIGADRICTCSASDNSVAMGGTLTYAYSGDSTATSGTTIATCTATDPFGFTATGTGSYTVTAASSTSSAGTGGSSSTSSVGVYAKEVWNSVDSGTTTVLEVNNGEIGITAVEFDVSKKVYGAWMKVEKKASLPSSVKTFSGDTYRKIQITKGSALKEDVLVNPTIDFKVPKTWLTENKIGKANIALHRYVDDNWVELSTTMGEDDGTYVHYSAETPGFSYFIIGEKVGAVSLTVEEVAEGGEEAVVEEVAEGTAESEEAPSKFPWKWAVVIVVLVIAIAVLIWLSKKN